MSEKVKKVLLILAAVLIVLMVAVIAYLAKQNKNLKLQATISPIVSSTLTEIQQSSKTATALVSRTSSSTQTATVTAIASEVTKSKEELIKEAYAQKSSTPIDKISITISKSSENSAYGSVSIGDEGGWYLAVYEDGSWKILGDGNGTLDCSILSGHTVPTSVVSECYDSASESLIKR